MAQSGDRGSAQARHPRLARTRKPRGFLYSASGRPRQVALRRAIVRGARGRWRGAWRAAHGPVALSVGALGVLSGSSIFLFAVVWQSCRSLLTTRTSASLEAVRPKTCLVVRRRLPLAAEDEACRRPVRSRWASRCWRSRVGVGTTRRPAGSSGPRRHANCRPRARSTLSRPVPRSRCLPGAALAASRAVGRRRSPTAPGPRVGARSISRAASSEAAILSRRPWRRVAPASLVGLTVSSTRCTARLRIERSGIRALRTVQDR